MASTLRNEIDPHISAVTNPAAKTGVQSVPHESPRTPATVQESPHGVSIILHNVTKRFEAQVVLRQLHLDIEPGKFVAIVGRSGCGKSTLLRLLAGLDDASEGELLRQGEAIDGIDPDTRYMFQDPRLLPWQSVLDNVMLGMNGLKSVDAERKAYAALKLVGLEDRAKDWPSVLSGGQRQRVALARALVGNPRLLLFDEPLGALDALTRIDMQRLLEHLWTQRGFTAVLVTHDVSEAVALADRVILIEEGRVALDVAITLARPRIKDSGFAHFEKLILERILSSESYADNRQTVDFDI